jgi:hypothetical protein
MFNLSLKWLMYFSFLRYRMKVLKNYLKEFFGLFWFKVVCSYKFLLLFFKKNRQIEVVSQNYFRRWFFDRAFIAINLELNNVIWIRVNGFKSHKVNRPILVDLQNFNGEFIEIEVFGFFDRKIFQIKIEGIKTLNSDSFNVITHNLTGIVLSPVQIGMKTKRIEIGVLKPVLVYTDKEIIQSTLKVKSQEFNLIEFI